MTLYQNHDVCLRRMIQLFGEILHDGTTPRLADILRRISDTAHAHIDALEVGPSLRVMAPEECK